MCPGCVRGVSRNLSENRSGDDTRPWSPATPYRPRNQSLLIVTASTISVFNPSSDAFSMSSSCSLSMKSMGERRLSSAAETLVRRVRLSTRSVAFPFVRQGPDTTSAVVEETVLLQVGPRPSHPIPQLLVCLLHHGRDSLVQLRVDADVRWRSLRPRRLTPSTSTPILGHDCDGHRLRARIRRCVMAIRDEYQAAASL